ncbi:MAG TPA: SET domain-containing protein-lysine N-methyltransferase [Candidatus Nanoarchaeia archaeon]|nr:SET domain-containing protein-lysine N-methyltransferase [Candidatus Nanoarchaeia archaeon]
MIIKKSRIHNNGAFAKKDIPKSTRIIEYVGEIVAAGEGTKRSEAQFEKAAKNHLIGQEYVFELDKKQDIDGSPLWNTARYINHSCTPNCRIEIKNDHIWIISKRKILKGEELYYDYGYDHEEYYEHPCKCGTKNCTGYIVGADYKKRFFKLLAKDRKSKSKKKK